MEKAESSSSAAAADLQALEIEGEVKANPMISSATPPAILLEQYTLESGPGFVAGIESIASSFDTMRKVRGDGNCFYRAFLFSYLEQLLAGLSSASDSDEEAPAAGAAGGKVRAEAQAELARMTALVDSSLADLVAVGFSEIAVQSFQDMLLELLEGLPTMTADGLLTLFQEDGSGDYYTWYVRVLTAASLRANSERFLPFVTDERTLDMKTYVPCVCVCVCALSLSFSQCQCHSQCQSQCRR